MNTITEGGSGMAYETKVILVSILQAIRKANTLQEAYEDVSEIANVEGVITKKWEDYQKKEQKEETGN